MDDHSAEIEYDPSIKTKDFQRLNMWANVVNIISMVGAGLVVVVVLGCRYTGMASSRKLTFRMSMWIGLSDLLFGLFSFLDVENDSLICPFITAAGFLCNLFYVFLTTSIAFNLHLSFLCTSPRAVKLRYKLLQEPILVIISFVLALVIAVPPLIISINKGKCVLFHTVSDPGTKVGFFWATIGVWEVICFLYTGIIILLVVNKLSRQSERLSKKQEKLVRPNLSRRTGVVPGLESTSDFNNNNNNNNNDDQRGTSQVSVFTRMAPAEPPQSTSLSHSFVRVAQRLIFLSMIPMLTQSFYIGIDSYFLYHGRRTLSLLYLFYLVPYSAGLLNALVFFIFDPAIRDLISEGKDKLRLRNSNSIFHQPNGDDYNQSMFQSTPDFDHLTSTQVNDPFGHHHRHHSNTYNPRSQTDPTDFNSLFNSLDPPAHHDNPPRGSSLPASHRSPNHHRFHNSLPIQNRDSLVAPQPKFSKSNGGNDSIKSNTNSIGSSIFIFVSDHSSYDTDSVLDSSSTLGTIVEDPPESATLPRPHQPPPIAPPPPSPRHFINSIQPPNHPPPPTNFISSPSSPPSRPTHQTSFHTTRTEPNSPNFPVTTNTHRTSYYSTTEFDSSPDHDSSPNHDSSPDHDHSSPTFAPPPSPSPLPPHSP